MSGQDADRSSEESGVIKYDTARGAITLTVKIVRQFFCPKATELEALAFAGYCKHTGLNPFLREVYLVKYDEAEPASMIVAYQSFMKRAERAEGYGGFRAGIVITPDDPDVQRHPLVEGDKAVPGVPPPFVAIEGTLIPPRWKLAGGWCVVSRANRPPVVATVRLEEYLQRRRDGKPTRTWERMPATMIRKVPIGQAHRDAWPDELAGLVLEEEGGAQIVDGEATGTDNAMMPHRKSERPAQPESTRAGDPGAELREVLDGNTPAGEAPALSAHSATPAETIPAATISATTSLEKTSDETTSHAEPTASQALAPGAVTFELNGTPVVTAGITKETILKAFKLSALADEVGGKGTAKNLLGAQFGVTSRTELNEGQGKAYVAELTKIINRHGKRT